jgi:hypothetical protein
MSHRPATCLAVTVVAAVAIALAVPLPAAAHDGVPGPSFTFSVGLPPAPPPWVAAALPPPWPCAPGRISPTVYYGWLDANRAAFLARWGWNPWRVARYEGWYRGYRAGLDAAFAPPARVALAHGRGYGHSRGNGWGHGHHGDD